MSMTSIAVDETLRLFADPLRQRIVELLAREQLCVCHLVDLTGARQPTISHHVKVLRDAGLVDSEPVGRFTYYRLRPEPIGALATQLSELAAHAESAARNRPVCS